MVYTYTPAYYSSFHDSITTLCKTVLPFSFKKRRMLPSTAEQKLSKLQSDNLKWQQDSFHQILNLMGLCREGIVPQTAVTAFRTQLLESLVRSPEQAPIIRDKLLFLQELLFAKCISEEEYHSAKQFLLQWRSLQGDEAPFMAAAAAPKESTDEEWSVIDLSDDRENLSNSQTKPIPRSAMRQIKGVGASVLSMVSHQRHAKNEAKSREGETRSILMPENRVPEEPINGGRKQTTFRGMFQKEHDSKSAKKQWGFEGLRKWRVSSSENEETPLKDDRSEISCRLVESPIGEGPDTMQMKEKLHPDGSASDFFIDKVLGEKIKKELSRIQAELCSPNPNLQFSGEQIEAISTKLPVDKADLKKFFPNLWCDQYGDVVLNVVRKEFKEHVGEMENLKNKRGSSKRWVAFDDDDDDGGENCDPNSGVHRDRSLPAEHGRRQPPASGDRKLRRTDLFVNPFGAPNPRHGSSTLSS